MIKFWNIFSICVAGTILSISIISLISWFNQQELEQFGLLKILGNVLMIGMSIYMLVLAIETYWKENNKSIVQFELYNVSGELCSLKYFGRDEYVEHLVLALAREQDNNMELKDRIEALDKK